MIQRIQSIWLLIAAICAFLSLKFSFYSGNILVNEQLQLSSLTTLGVTNNSTEGSAYNFLSLLLAAATGIIALIGIFMYANRKTQIRFTLVALLLSIAEVIYMFILTNDFADGTLSLTSVFTFIPPIFLFLAWRGIYKDEKLVRSMDRLR